MKAGCLLFVLWLALPCAGAVEGEINLPTIKPEGQLAQALRGIDRIHQRLETLAADVTQIKTSALLAEPVVSNGRLRYRKPSRIRWDYQPPDAMVLLIADGELTAYYPDLERADVVDVRRYQQRLLRVMGIGQSTEMLQRDYEIEFAGRILPDASAPEQLIPLELRGENPPRPMPTGRLTVLDLEPRRRRLERRIERIRIWLDEATWLPRMMRLAEGRGDASLVIFRSIEPNAELSDDAFELDLPDSVEITRRASTGAVEAAP